MCTQFLTEAIAELDISMSCIQFESWDAVAVETIPTWTLGINNPKFISILRANLSLLENFHKEKKLGVTRLMVSRKRCLD